MNGIPLCELNALRRIEAHFDGAYVSLLTKLGHYHPELEHSTEEEQGEDKQGEVQQLVSEQGDGEEVTGSEDESEDDSESSENDDDPWAEKGDVSQEGSEYSFSEDGTAFIAAHCKPELVSLALCFAKLLNKSLLAAERSAQLESQVNILTREVVSLRAVAANSHELCQNGGQPVNSRSSTGKKTVTAAGKPKASSLIAFKAAIDQEMDSYIEAKNQEMETMERSYKNTIFGLTMAVDYLKKEIAGRVQQIQLYESVYGTTEPAAEEKIAQMSRIWTQLVYEIALNRHKTIVRLAAAARNDPANESTSTGAGGQSEGELDTLCSLLTSGCPYTRPQFVNFSSFGQVQHVSLYLEKGKAIGVWISGGAQCHMPLIIQKVEVGSVAAASGQLQPGDILLSVQNFDMVGTSQAYAAQLLKSLSGWCRLGFVRIPVPDIAQTLANREDFQFELMYDNFPEKEEEDGEDEDDQGTFTGESGSLVEDGENEDKKGDEESEELESETASGESE